jgi:hypothetical protein
VFDQLLLSQSNPVSSPIAVFQADTKNHAAILDQYGKLPLTFEANHGQTDSRVKFLSRTSGYRSGGILILRYNCVEIFHSPARLRVPCPHCRIRNLPVRGERLPANFP